MKEDTSNKNIKCTPSIDQWTEPDSYATNEVFVQDKIKLVLENTKQDMDNIMETSFQHNDKVEQETDTENFDFVNFRSKKTLINNDSAIEVNSNNAVSF